MNKRIGYIDGMRGIGAMLVVFCHLACTFIPGLYWLDPNGAFGRIWHGTPLNVITNGNVAVQFFFLISGYMITMKNFGEATINIVGGGKGYRPLLDRVRNSMRITIPAILLSFLLMRLRLCFHLEALNLDERLAFLEGYCNFYPTWTSLIKDNVFVLLTGSIYVGPLWTMRYDLLGFVGVLITNNYALSNKNEVERKWIYFIVAVLFMHVDANLVAFFVGAFVWDLLHTLKEENTVNLYVRKIVKSKIGRILLGIVGIYCASIPISGCSGIYVPFGIILDYIPEVAIRAFGLGILLLVIAQTSSAQTVLSISPLRFLGRYSAYIYAFHWQIILSIGCFVFVSWHDKVPYKWLVVLISVVCIILTVISSVIYVKLYQKIKGKLVLRKQ